MNTVNMFEESKLYGLGISLVVIMLLVRSYYSIVLPSQGGEYERERWNRRQKNKKSAQLRTAKATSAQQRQKKKKKNQTHLSLIHI